MDKHREIILYKQQVVIHSDIILENIWYKLWLSQIIIDAMRGF